MRGISFSAVSRFDKSSHAGVHTQDELELNLRDSPSPSYSSPSAASPATNAAAKMMKKLSTTFRRKGSVSTYHQPQPQQKQSSAGSSITTTTTSGTTASSGRNTGDHALFSSMSSEGATANQNGVAQVTTRSSVPLPASRGAVSSRAMTFTAPSRTPSLSASRANGGSDLRHASDETTNNHTARHTSSASSFPVGMDIPFFAGDRRQPPPRAHNPALAVVRGTPANDNSLKPSLHRISPSVSPNSPTPPSSSSPTEDDPLSDSRLSLPLPSSATTIHQHLSSSAGATAPVLREANYHSDDNNNPPTLSYLTSPLPSPTVPGNHNGNVTANQASTNTLATGSLPPLGGRHRYFSFDADTARKAGAAAALAPSRAHEVGPPPLLSSAVQTGRARRIAQQQQQPANQQQAVVHGNGSGKQRHPRRRWLLPLSESPDKPRLFTPQAPAFARITRHRDRAEARTLASVSTFLEAEIDRMAAHVHTHSQTNNYSQQQSTHQLQQQGNAPSGAFQQLCSSKRSHHNVHGNQNNNQNAIYAGRSVHCSAECADNCPLAAYLPAAIERFRSLLGILEERYDTIEQVYVKSEEYARAMGRFFNVAPEQLEAVSTTGDESSKSSLNSKSRHGKGSNGGVASGSRENRKSFR